MKKSKLLITGLCGVLCFSLAGLAYAQEKSNETSIVSDIGAVETLTGENLYRDTNGGQISIDGENWISQSSDEENNTPEVKWWTAAEYENWISKQKKELEALIGTGDGWYDGQGTFHEWTQESVASTIAEYYEILENIKNSVLYSKDDGDGDSYAMVPPSEDVVSNYGVDVIKEDGESVHIGSYSTQKELDEAINKAVESGKITEQEAATAYLQ